MTANLERGQVVLLQKTGYPWEGDIRFEVFPETPQEFTLAVRIPGWCREAKIRVNGEEADVSPLVERGVREDSTALAEGRPGGTFPCYAR